MTGAVSDNRTKTPRAMPSPDPSDLDALLNDPAFRRWVYAPTDDADQYWSAWLSQHPERRAAVETARHLLLDVRGKVPRLSDEELDGRIAALLTQTEERPRPIVRLWTRYARYAAVVLALLGSVVLWQLARRARTPTAAESSVAVDIRRVAVKNEGTRPRLITLGDGSSVLLQAGSRLVYESPFRPDTRRVWLSGEAFFEVTKNPRRPFRVRAANRFTTEVRGTSFRIRAYADGTPALVVVKTGRVAVYQSAVPNRPPEAVLAARQQVLVPADRTPLRPDSTAVAPAFAIERQSFVFQARPLREVVAVLEAAYGVSITLSPALANCSLTAALGDEPLPEKLRLLSAALDATYQFTGTQIRLDGPGCSATPSL